MTWVAVAIAGSAIIGGVAAGSAANEQGNAASDASHQQWLQYMRTRDELMPWNQAGVTSLMNLKNLTGQGQGGFDPNAPLVKPFGMEDFQQSPAYQFNLQEGQDAINKAASARGNMYAPATLQDIGKYSQGLASNEFQNAYGNYNQNQQNIWDRLYSMSGSGQNAAAQQGAFGAAAAGQVGQNTIGAGNAQAAGIMGMGNAAQGGIQNAYWQYLANQQQPTYGGGGGANSEPIRGF